MKNYKQLISKINLKHAIIIAVLMSIGTASNGQEQHLEDLLQFNKDESMSNDEMYSSSTLVDDATYEVNYGNESGCDYKVIFQFQSTCTGCNTSAGTIDAGLQSSFTYNTPLTGCSGGTPCGTILIINQTTTGSTTLPACQSNAEQFSTISCQGTTWNVATYYCDEIRIYE